jgi:hypothetical protein
MPKNAARLCGFTILLILTCFALGSVGQDEPKTKSKSGAAKASTITGCIQKGQETNGYTLKSSDGKMYELMPGTQDLSPHVGHTVTLTGSKTHAAKATEAKKDVSEKKEAAGSPHTDFKVTGLKMVSESCQ